MVRLFVLLVVLLCGTEAASRSGTDSVRQKMQERSLRTRSDYLSLPMKMTTFPVGAWMGRMVNGAIVARAPVTTNPSAAKLEGGGEKGSPKSKGGSPKHSTGSTSPKSKAGSPKHSTGSTSPRDSLKGKGYDPKQDEVDLKEVSSEVTRRVVNKPDLLEDALVIRKAPESAATQAVLSGTTVVRGVVTFVCGFVPGAGVVALTVDGALVMVDVTAVSADAALNLDVEGMSKLRALKERGKAAVRAAGGNFLQEVYNKINGEVLHTVIPGLGVAHGAAQIVTGSVAIKDLATDGKWSEESVESYEKQGLGFKLISKSAASFGRLHQDLLKRGLATNEASIRSTFALTYVGRPMPMGLGMMG